MNGSSSTILGISAFLAAFASSTHLSLAQALVPNLGAGGPQLAVLVEEVTRSGAPTGSSMMFPASPAPLPGGGVLPVVGVIGSYTVDLTVTLTTDPAPGIVISGAPGTITKSGSAPTRLHITADGGLSVPQGADTLAHLALVGDASGECGINFSAAAGFPATGGDISWTAFPSGIYLTLYHADPIEEYRLDQPIRHAGAVAIRTFLSTDISAMGDTVTLPASGNATVGKPIENSPIPDFVSQATLNAVFDGEIGNGGTVCEFDPAKFGVSSFRPGSFDHVFALLDLVDTSRSRAYEVGLSELNYSATPSALLGLNWRGFEGLDTVVRDRETLAYTGGASFDADQLFHHKTIDQILLTQIAPDRTGFGLATYRTDGTQIGGWYFERTDGKTFGERIGIDFDDGSPDIRITADLIDESVLNSEGFRALVAQNDKISADFLNKPNLGLQLADIEFNPAYFASHPAEDPETYQRLVSDPRNLASAVDALAGTTLLATHGPSSPRFDRALRIGGALSGRTFPTADGGLIHGGSAGFGQPEQTVIILPDGSTVTLDQEELLGLGGGTFGLRAADENTLHYVDFLSRTVCQVAYSLALDIDPPVVEVEVFSTGAGHAFHQGATHNLTYKVEPAGIILTDSPSTSFLFTELSSATVPVEIDTSTDVSDAFIFSDAAVEVTPWTPDSTVVSNLPQAVDHNEFSGTTIGIDLRNVNPPAPPPTLNAGIELTNSDSVTFTWDTKPGRTYTVRTTTDPASGPPSTWPSPPGGIDLDSTQNTFTFSDLDTEPFRLMRVEENAP